MERICSLAWIKTSGPLHFAVAVRLCWASFWHMKSTEPYGLCAVSKPFQHMPSLTPQPPLNGSCYCVWNDKRFESFQAVVPFFLNGLIAFLSGTAHKSVAESCFLHFLCSSQSLDPNWTPCCVQIGHLTTARCIAALSDLHVSSLTSCFNVSVKYLSAQQNWFLFLFFFNSRCVLQWKAGCSKKSLNVLLSRNQLNDVQFIMHLSPKQESFLVRIHMI